MSVANGLFAAEDGLPRCFWCAASPAYRHYHDTEWGFPVSDDRRLFAVSRWVYRQLTS